MKHSPQTHFYDYAYSPRVNPFPMLLKLKSHENVQTYMTLLQSRIDRSLLEHQRKDKQEHPFLTTIQARLRSSREAGRGSPGIWSLTLQKIRQARQPSDLIDILRHLHELGVKALFEITRDLDLENPESQILYLHITDPFVHFNVNWSALGKLELRKEVSDWEKDLYRHCPAKAVLQNSQACFNPHQLVADTRVGARTSCNTERLNWLVPYFYPFRIDRYSVDHAPFFHYLGEQMMNIEHLNQWKEYFIAVFLTHCARWFEDGTGHRELQLLEAGEAWRQDAGYLYVAQHRQRLETVRPRVEEMCQRLKATLRQFIQHSDWKPSTRKTALAKLERMEMLIGWSEEGWHEWAETLKSLVLPSIDAYDECIAAGHRFQYRQVFQGLKRPTNRREWRYVGFATVNACYSREMNALYLPAALMQPPFYFDEHTQHMAENYAGLGSIIAHEIFHGFDADSHAINHENRLADWWHPKDQEKYESQVAKMIALYQARDRKELIHSHYHTRGVSVQEMKIDARLCLSENIADMVALAMAYYALVFEYLDQHHTTPPKEMLHQFFVFFAVSQAQLLSVETLAHQLREDMHAPAAARVNFPLSVFAPFLHLYRVLTPHAMYTDQNLRPNFFGPRLFSSLQKVILARKQQ